MKTTRLLTALAVVSSLLAASLVFFYLQGTEDRLLSSLQPTKILITTQEIAPGTPISEVEDLTEEVSLPSKSFPRGAIQNLSDVAPGLVLMSRIPAGSYLFPSQFDKSERLTGGFLVPLGKVVLTISLPAEDALSDFIKAGSSVAVYGTSQGGSELIVDSAEVLSISTANQKASVTVALRPEEVKKLLVVKKQGTLQLALASANSQLKKVTP